MDRVGPESSLPLWRKLCFAVGGVPYQMTSTVIGFFLNIFLLEVAEVKPSYVAVVLFSGKAWDAVTDPACGYLVQRTSSRWGKMRPWILFSAPFSCAAYFMLFFVPWRYQEVDHRSETEASMEEKLAYYFVIFCLFQGFLTALHVPYTALTMYVTTQQKERDSITAYRMWFEALGVLAAVVIQGQLVQSTRCTDDDDDTSVTVQDMEDREWSYRIGSFVVIGIYLICSCTVFFGVKEEKDDRTDGDSSGLFKGLKLVFSFTPYLKAAMTFLFLSLAVGIVQGNVALYTTHSLKLGDYFSIFILVLLLVSIFAMPVWQFVILRFGKKTAYAAGIIILMPTFICQMYVPEKSMALYFVVIVFAGLGVSVSLLLPWSVLPDVLDLFMLEKRTRKDALFYAYYVFFSKLALGLGLGISQVVLSFGGYKTGECKQPDSVGQTLRLLVTPAPVVFLLVALLFLWSYPITEARRNEIREEVLRYRDQLNKASLDSSRSYESIAASSSDVVTQF
ncbi:sodium-dependent lysophosphatidylcholine symporter 1-B-like isoform X2 [Pomacea canaliculata]|uniref:sodium-dependent lysophosphatidylcholine symporter 1-B-like isoform X2 n=1 Tax=Pomacea canaliculata TaxID=400727 RepID=UPI000D72FC5C|nr:sodium-dependent lysophosphatidylcholine symporter 1-B-like isoform X2 [Pomacea canaliculata]